MLSAAERQELAENAMEQLASGLNKAAEAMQGAEEAKEGEEGDLPKKDLSNLQDQELYQLLEEAYSYKRPKDRQGKSEMFRELLEKAEENSSGEEQWDINFRKHLQHSDTGGGKKKKKKVSESSGRGGSLSNLSCLSDSEYSSSGKARAGAGKKGRSSVSARSREGGSLPPTKFEHVMLLEAQTTGQPAAGAGQGAAGLAWDTGGGPRQGEGGPLLLHSSSDSMLRKLVVAETAIDMEPAVGAGAGQDCDTDSNKTETEEIEMVELEGGYRTQEAMEGTREESAPLLAARHRLETRGRLVGSYGDPEEGQGTRETGAEEEAKPGLDENGNPMGPGTAASGPFPIMDPQLRPLSIYRHTPVFRPQKLTVPSVSDREQDPRQSLVPEPRGEPRPAGGEGGPARRKVRRKRLQEEERGVMKAEDIEGYRGKEDLDSILSFIDGGGLGGKKKKPAEKVVEKKKASRDAKEEKGDKGRRKKEKSVEKEEKAAVTKKLSVDNSSEAEALEDDDDDDDLDAEDAEDAPCVQEVEPRPAPLGKAGPSSLASCGRANSAPSNDSGHVSAEPGSLPSLSSTKDMSIASSPPLDLDPGEDLAAGEELHNTVTEFTKVTKKQRRKRAGGVRERPERPYQQGSAFAEENRGRGGEAPPARAGGAEGEDWYRPTYGRARGAREAVQGAKSACSVPPSDASDTDDHDSVHSLPVGSSRKREREARSVSSGHTPQASYADIARHAAALYTQQAGQQQTAVYREQLQHREAGPGPGPLACSVGEDGLSFHYSTEETLGPAPPAGPPPRAASEPSDPRRPPPAALPLDTGSSRPGGAITFGFEVNEDLLAMTEEAEESEAPDSLAHCNDTSIEESPGVRGGAVYTCHNNSDDNVMMKNLLSLTNKSRDNMLACSEEVPASEGSPGRGIQREEVDVRKFNYDVILGFVSKAWDRVNKELAAGSPVIYYSS